MECQELRDLILSDTEMRITHSDTRVGCRIELPILEPSGDSIGVIVAKSSSGYLVHDGGHINGLLFQSAPGAAAKSDLRTVGSLIESAGLMQNRDTGIVCVQTIRESIPYWVYELGRTIAVVASTVPSRRPRPRLPRRLGARVQKAVTTRLASDGVIDVIRQSLNVRGVSQQTHRVDFSYTLPRSPISPEQTFFVLAVDFDIKDPMNRARRSLVTATDLGTIDPSPKVRVVYSTGSENGRTGPAVSLLRAAGDKSGLFENYSWDDRDERSAFFEKVELEVSPLLSSSTP